ncbi:MAG: cobalamin-binding protein [Planctomycetales bacterium]
MIHPSPRRVISLIASATETVAALGCGDWLVGRSHECDYPPAVQALPVCTRARVDISASGIEIDRQIKSLLQNAVSIYELDTDLLESLRPDLVITQSQCEVCAVSLNDVEQALGQVVSSQPRIVSLKPDGLPEVWQGIEQVASALGVADRGAALVEQSQQRLARIEERVRGVPQRPTVACIEWIDPLMAGGNWVPDLVRIAGGINLFGEAGRHSPWMTWEELAAQDPDVIVVLPCGWDIPRCRTEMRPLTDRPGWAGLKAVQRQQVYLTDGNQYFNRPGPRVVESAEILAEILHPVLFAFGHQGIGWERLRHRD